MTAKTTEDDARRRVEEAGKRKGLEVARWDGYEGASRTFGVLRCLKDDCGHHWSPRYKRAVGKYGCPKCKVAAQWITEDDARRRVEEAGNRKGFEIARWDGYEGSQKPFGALRCLVEGCGHHWSPRYDLAVGKHGCPKCAVAKTAAAQWITEDEARRRVEEAGRRKGFEIARWDGYEGSQKPFGALRCLVEGCGHHWSPLYQGAVGKKGCLKCAEYGFDPSKPAWLYYDQIDASSALGFGAVLYKIGITNRTPDDRYAAKDRRLVTPVRRVRYENGADARNEERRILLTFAADRYEGPDILQSGNTELFARDVLGIDAPQFDLAA